ncbi:hypothetical protein R3Q56_004181 [Pseudomonas aeruginosa]|nr:hypothetical protein [Pseudomonas aeruginosa]
MSKILSLLIQRDNILQETADASIPLPERMAFRLAEQVTPEPGSAHDLDWLVGKALGEASYVHMEPEAGIIIFSFADRSILCVLSTGHMFGVTDGTQQSVQKVISWLEQQGLSEGARTLH